MSGNLFGLKKAVFVLFMLWMTISLTGCAGGIMGIISMIMGVVNQITSMFSGESSSDKDSSASNQDSNTSNQDINSLTRGETAKAREAVEWSNARQKERSQVLDNENPLSETPSGEGSLFTREKNSSANTPAPLEPRNGGLFTRDRQTNSENSGTAIKRSTFAQPVAITPSVPKPITPSKVPSTSYPGVTDTQSNVSNQGNSNSGINLGD